MLKPFSIPSWSLRYECGLCIKVEHRAGLRNGTNHDPGARVRAIDLGMLQDDSRLGVQLDGAGSARRQRDVDGASREADPDIGSWHAVSSVFAPKP